MAASKPTGVHYALIIFVMLTLTFGVMAFMFGRQLSDNTALRDQAENKTRELESARSKLDEQLTALKNLVGHNYADVVNPSDPSGANTVSGAIKGDLALAGEPAQTTLSGAIHTMAEKIRQLTSERDARKRELDTTNASLLALQNEFQKKVDEESQARSSAESTLQDKIKTTEDDLKVKETLISDLEKSKSELEALYDAEQAAHASDVRDREKSVQNYKAVAADLQQELDKTRQVSFEAADGKIVSVDNLTRTAYINLGKSDGLPLRTSFSVYTKANQGVARGKDDIKGAIEVIQILGPHLSVVRILDDNIYNPIAPGDPVFTPLWHVGQKISFSIVGGIDLDGDGQSDRDLFHELVKASGAVIDNEVDEDGNLRGDGISINTRFLIIGDIPVEPPSSPSKLAMYNKLKQNQLLLSNQAAERGVRVVTLDNFLNYIGYRPTYSIYKPGSHRKQGELRGGAVSKRADGTTVRGTSDAEAQLKGMDRRDRPNVPQQQVPGQRTFIK